MFKLRKFHLDNLGTDILSFSNTTLDFVDGTAGTVVDNSIISCENGGGKTTLLSMFFTLLKPDKRKFIQTMQSSNHRFNDYIKKTPGLILAEFIEYKELSIETIIVGQYVVMRSDGTTSRDFFTFKSSTGSGAFESVPSIGRGTLSKADDIRAYFNEHKSIYVTQDQSEWEAKLESDGFDYKQIETQIMFCKSEGGIDKFVDFDKERDFLDTFFELTMQEHEVDEVGNQVNKVIQQQQELPKFEEQVFQLNQITLLVKSFIGVSSEAESKKKELFELTSSAHGYWKYANEQLKKLMEEIAFASTSMKEQGIELKAIKKSILSSKRSLKMIELGGLNIDAINYDSEKNKELKSHADNLKKEEMIDLANYYLNYLVALRNYEQKEKVMIQLTKGLDEVRAGIKDLKIHRSRTVEVKLEDLVSKIKDIRSEISTIEQKSQEEKKTISSLKSAEKDQDKAILEAEHFISLHNSEQKRLLDKGYIDPQVDFNSLVSRIKISLDDLDAKVTHDAKRIELARDSQQKKLAEQRAHQSIQAKTQSEFEGLRLLEENYIKQEFNIRESLSDFLQIPVDEVDAYGDYIQFSIDPIIGAQQAAVSELNRERFKLVAEYESIESSNGLMVDSEVASLKEQLENAGISSKFALDYLIEIENNDIESVASIVATNPARYLGLMVDSEKKLDEVFAQAESWKINKPVTISITDNQESDIEDGVRVVLPLSNVLYSRDETAQYLVRLGDKISEIGENINLKQNIMDAAQKLKTRVELFHQQNPKLDCLKRKEDLRVLQAKLDEQALILHKFNEDIEKQSVSIASIDKMLNRERLELADKKLHNDEIRSFRDVYASNLVFNQKKLNTAKSELAKIRKETEVAESYLEKLREMARANQNIIAQLESKATFFEKDMSLYGIRAEDRAGYSYSQGLLDLSTEQLDTDIKASEYQLSLKEKDAGHSIKQEELATLERNKDNLYSLFIEQKGSFDESDIVQVAASKDHSILAQEKADIRELLNKSNRVIAELDVKIGSIKSKITEIEISNDYTKSGYEKYSGESRAFLEQEEEEESSLLKDALEKEISLLDSISGLEKDLAEKSTRKNDFAVLEAILSGIAGDKSNPVEAKYFSLDNAKVEFDGMSDSIRQAEKESQILGDRAREAFDKFFAKINNDSFKSSNPDMIGLTKISQDTLSEDAERLYKDLDACIELIKHKIESANSHIDRAVASLQGRVMVGLRRLREACAIKIPEGIEGISGLNVIKSSSAGRRVMAMENEVMASNLNHFIRKCIKENVYPGKLLTEAVIALARSYDRDGILGISILQIREGRHDYYPIRDLKSSGGERLTTALLLYVTTLSLSGTNGHSGGFLLTDNIFGKCTKSDFVKTQLILANKLGFQLVSTTGIQDKGFMSQYSKTLSMKPYLLEGNAGRLINQKSMFEGHYHDEDNSIQEEAS